MTLETRWVLGHLAGPNTAEAAAERRGGKSMPGRHEHQCARPEGLAHSRATMSIRGQRWEQHGNTRHPTVWSVHMNSLKHCNDPVRVELSSCLFDRGTN